MNLLPKSPEEELDHLHDKPRLDLRESARLFLTLIQTLAEVWPVGLLFVLGCDARAAQVPLGSKSSGCAESSLSCIVTRATTPLYDVKLFTCASRPEQHIVDGTCQIVDPSVASDKIRFGDLDRNRADFPIVPSMSIS